MPENDSGHLSGKVLSSLNGMRLDACLAKLFPDYSRARLQQMIENGCVMLNGKTVSSKKVIVKTEDEIRLPVPEEPEGMNGAVPENIPLSILYEDPDLLVIDKPAGMVVHPAAGNWTGTVVNALLGRKENFSDDFEEVDLLRPGIVHRLDKDTSGCLVVAKNSLVMHKLSAMFAERLVHKTYAAIVSPPPAMMSGEIRTLIGRHSVNRKKMAVVQKNGREAVTLYTVAGTGMIGKTRAALLHVRILTGRTHQIRVHMAHIHSPVIGDSLYGGRIPAPRQMLHAWKITFPHPVTGEKLTFESPFPQDFASFSETLTEKGL